jgi:hypothetical protein
MSTRTIKLKSPKEDDRFKEARHNLEKINKVLNTVPERKKLVFFSVRGDWTPTSCLTKEFS